MTKISDILKQQNIFSKEIKLMLQRGSVLINGKAVGEDLQLGEITFQMPWDDFIFDVNSNKKEFTIGTIPLHSMEYTLGHEVWQMLADSDWADDRVKFWNKYQVLRFSKKKAIVINKNKTVILT